MVAFGTNKVINTETNAQLNQQLNSIPISSQPLPQATINPQQITTNNVQAEEKKSKVIQIISILLFIIAVIYGFSAIRILGVLLILNKVSSIGGLSLLFLRDFPTFGLIPIIFSIITLILFYSAIKIRNSSKFSFWLGIVLLSFVFIPLSILTIILVTPLYNITGGNSASAIPSFSLSNISLVSFIDPSLILYFLTFFMLVFSFKKFHFENTGISKKSKVFLIILTIFFVIPIISFMSLAYLKANDKSYGYTNAQSKISYHLYNPSYIPLGLVAGTNFSSAKLADKNDATSIIFNSPLNQVQQSGDEVTPLIILKEVRIDDGFNLSSFVSTNYKNATLTKQVPLSISGVQSGIYTESKVLIGLNFVTKDNVFINLSAVKVPMDELIRMAESLK